MVAPDAKDALLERRETDVGSNRIRHSRHVHAPGRGGIFSDHQFVFDAVGKSSFSKCKPIMERGGIYISSEPGWMAQNLFLPIFTAVFGSKRVIFPFPGDRAGSVRFIQKLLGEGKFSPVIDRKYPLEEIADAYRYVEKGQKTGNVIITPDH